MKAEKKMLFNQVKIREVDSATIKKIITNYHKIVAQLYNKPRRTTEQTPQQEMYKLKTAVMKYKLKRKRRELKEMGQVCCIYVLKRHTNKSQTNHTPRQVQRKRERKQEWWRVRNKAYITSLIDIQDRHVVRLIIRVDCDFVSLYLLRWHHLIRGNISFIAWGMTL